MALIGGEVATKRINLSTSGTDVGEDRLSALPDDLLILILLRLTVDEAARTSVLSRRWRRTWVLLPELAFCSAPSNLHIREVLEVDAPEAPALRSILVTTADDTPESVAAWLPPAARRLSGGLIYRNLVEGHEGWNEEVDGAIPLPCFWNATTIKLDLGFLALALPSSGAFALLTELSLERVRFQGTCELGDIVSSLRCPRLRHLHIKNALGVARLTVHSKSLLEMHLFTMNGLQQLNIDAPVLNELMLCHCFAQNQPVANISAPRLVSLHWMDAYDPRYVQLGNLEKLQRLSTRIFHVYGDHYCNDSVLQFLQHFRLRVMHTLNMLLSYPLEGCKSQYLMEDITYLPHTTELTISTFNKGHSFGAASFHLLRLCASIR